jgi:hypothetical protein
MIPVEEQEERKDSERGPVSMPSSLGREMSMLWAASSVGEAIATRIRVVVLHKQWHTGQGEIKGVIPHDGTCNHPLTPFPATGAPRGALQLGANIRIYRTLYHVLSIRTV